MPEARIVQAIAGIGRDAWDGLFPGVVETYDYLAAVEAAGLEGFRFRYAVVEEGGGVRAAMPFFLTEYRLDTTFSGAGKRFAAAVYRLAPAMLTLRLACLGSPCTESGVAGFAADVREADKPALLKALMGAFEGEARRERCSLRAVKDVVAADQPLWSSCLLGLGYRPTPGQPIASLAIDFPDLETYLARLSPATRKDMRRKLRALDGVEIEIVEDVAPVLDEVVALYRQTRARAEMQFEDLTPAFFTGVAERLKGRAFYVLYRVDGDLLAANLMIQSEGVLLDKFFCMDEARGRRHNLYFLSWFTNLRLCLERGLAVYQSGQAGYRNKVRLGSALTLTAMYFRHRNVVINGVLQRVAPFFAMNHEAELAA